MKKNSFFLGSLLSFCALLIVSSPFFTHVIYADSTLTGDANGDCMVDGVDFSAWLGHYPSSNPSGPTDGDLDSNGAVDGADFVVWLSGYGLTCDTITPEPTTTPDPNEIDISVCDPSHGPFTVDIDNLYNPFVVGQEYTIVSPDGEKVVITVLDKKEVVAGVDTRVVKEYETVNGDVEEISQNYFAQAPDGTVCYFGEYVDEYGSDGTIIGHDGTWRAGGVNKPGIQMPPHPAVGQTYLQENAPGIAVDRAHHFSFEPTYTTPAGTFHNVLLVDENPLSTKRYAPGVGMIFDDGAVLTKF